MSTMHLPRLRFSSIGLIVLAVAVAIGAAAAVVRTNGLASEPQENTARRYALAYLRTYDIESLSQRVDFRPLPNQRYIVGGLPNDRYGNQRSVSLVYRVGQFCGVNWWRVEIAVIDDEIVESLIARENGQWPRNGKVRSR